MLGSSAMLTRSSTPWLGAAAIVRRVAAGEVSPVDLVEELIERQAALDDTLHAFIEVDTDAARADAARAAVAVRHGRRLGPLHGVPFAVKDLIDVRGRPTRAQSRSRSGVPARTDAAIVAQLRRAGAILLGKLNLEELGIGFEEDDTPWPAPRNPWAIGHTPGGSSSGAGVAVAAGLVPLAIGTDTAGSIRMPAALCGVVGFKPRSGSIDCRGVLPLSPSLDQVGWITRSVEDSRTVLNALNGQVASASPAPDLRGMRLGVIHHFFSRDMPATPELTAALEAALSSFADLGAELVELEMEPAQIYERCGGAILAAEAYALHGRRLVADERVFGSGARATLRAGAAVDRAAYGHARHQRRTLQRLLGVGIAAAGIDVLVTAVAPGAAWRFGDGARRRTVGDRSMRIVFNVLGFPAMALPIGLTSDRLPLSMQLAAPPARGDAIFDVGEAYQRVTSWHRKQPTYAIDA